MKNYLKANLTVKLFVLVCSVLIATSLLICGLFSVIMPKSYVEMQTEELEQKLQALINKLEDKSMAQAKEDLSKLAESTSVYLELHSAYGDVIGSFGDNNQVYSSSDIIITENDVSYSFNENILAEGTQTSQKEVSIGGETYTLIAYGNTTQTVNEVIRILQNTIPLIIVVMVLLSFTISLFLSRFITRPIKEINQCAKKIAELSFDTHCVENRNDELGELAHSINELSAKLNVALFSLQDELDKEKALEKSQRLFFSAASHELKTPLTVIKGNLEGMVYGYKEYENKDTYISKTLRTATQMEHLIGEILTFSAMQGNEYALTKESVNLRTLIEEQLIHFTEMIELKSFHVVANLTDITIDADKKLLTKAIGNIISNALHYSPENETITVTLTDKELVIENTGISISSEDIEKLFEPFYRVDKSRSRQTGGSGLGLHFVKTILDKHELHFYITSDNNTVCFSIKL